MSEEVEVGITVRKQEDFSEWYTQVVLRAELADYAPVKGFMVLRPYGYAIWERIQEVFDRGFKELGVQNAYFPTLIPEEFLKREAQHFKGFTPEVFWVTQSGDEALGERLAVRPTSETIAYASYSKWVQSWRDLPLRLNFWNSVLRAEIKSTKPFIRTSEFLWQEGHTVHASKQEADEEAHRMLRLYEHLVEEYLALPALTGLKSEKDKFAGALYTLTLEAMMPDGRALQLGTSHNLGENFSRAFEIRYQGRDGQWHHTWQTSWGVSWRLIGGVVMVHGDDHGLLLPPRIAPIQVVIVPIYYRGEQKQRVLEKSSLLLQRLKEAGLRVHVDDREDYTPGWKFNQWELKGVPLRLELGPREVEAALATLVRRDTRERITVKDEELVIRVNALLEDLQRSLLDKARNGLKAMTHASQDYGEFRRIMEEKGGFVEAGWCGERRCEDRVKDETGADIRVLPLGEDASGELCIVCGSPAKSAAYFAKAY